MTASAAVAGFVKRRVRELNNPHLSKSLYCALVQPILEYASVVWAPYRAIDKSRIESVQKQFLLFALRSLNFDRTDFRLPPYKCRLLLLNMTTLDDRRELASALLIFDLLEGKIKSEALQEKIALVEGRYDLRQSNFLREVRYRTDFEGNDPISRAICVFNDYAERFEPNVTRLTFRNSIIRAKMTLFS